MHWYNISFVQHCIKLNPFSFPCRHNTASCFVDIAEEYWFYLSFENSICNDYITEKFWRTLDLKVVPIVMGGGNYFKDAPKMVVFSYLAQCSGQKDHY